MTTKQEIIEKINQDWGDSPPSRICMSILDYLLNTNKAIYSHITYGSLRKIIGNDYDDSAILIAVQYLCGERINLLNASFEIIDDDENRVDIAHDDLKLAHKTGQLFHPENGELIHNFEENVYIYFQPSEIVKSIV